MFIDKIADEIRTLLPAEMIPPNSDELFDMYAVLAVAKGTVVSNRDVHAAWVAWMARRDEGHAALVPYEDLSGDTACPDTPYRNAIRAVARTIGGLDSALFPGGAPQEGDREYIFKLYAMMVQSSESLVARRQGVNTFFVTINGALLTAIGLVIRSGGDDQVAAMGVLAIAIAGELFSWAWHSLIRSFGQLNTGKFAVINRLEDLLPARIYAAEWEALERGEDPKVYRSFTSREIWVPRIAIGIYAIAIAASATAGLGVWSP